MNVPGPDHEVHRWRQVAVVVALLAVIGALWWMLALMRPLPPRVVVMSTGPAGSAFPGFAERYRAAFARVGIDLRLRPTAGSVENLALLNDRNSDVSVGFVEGGLADLERDSGLVSLGTLFYEPLWIFVRSTDDQPKLTDFIAKRFSSGAEGSSTRAFAQRLLALNGVTADVPLLAYSPQEAADRLLAGDLAGATFMTSWDSPVIRQLSAAPEVRLVGFPRADAYVALYPYFNKLVVPMGVGNMAKNLPPTDVQLISTKATLVVRKDLHPAIQYLLLDAATQIHGGPGIFQKAGQFPAAEAIDLPLSDHARTFYTSGRPFLQRYLPFWLAVLAGQLLVLLIPVVGVLYPLLRLAPVLYAWSMRRRIFRLYGELTHLEDDLEKGRPAEELRPRLDRLEQRANHIHVPTAFRQLQYTLRDHIGLVRQRLG
jgi:TRAP-type uncharacterized transport system substrate-binding protein